MERRLVDVTDNSTIVIYESGFVTRGWFSNGCYFVTPYGNAPASEWVRYAARSEVLVDGWAGAAAELGFESEAAFWHWVSANGDPEFIDDDKDPVDKDPVGSYELCFVEEYQWDFDDELPF